jgi:multidrug efflux pump
MRIWLDSNAMNKYQLTPLDIINQLKTQNDQIAAGQLGGTPSIPGTAAECLDHRANPPEITGRVWPRDAQGEPGRLDGSSEGCGSH